MSGDFSYDADDDGLAYDDDWLYVDEDYPLADELAETSVPDPGYAGTNYEILLDGYFYDDIYEFWDDLEYGQDVYWDCQVKRGKSQAGAQESHVSEKRHGSPQKRRRPSDVHARSKPKITTSYPPVLFMTHKEREDKIRGNVKEVQGNKSAAFLADWRTRYARDEPSIVKAMPADMQEAAKTFGNDEDVLDGQSVDTSLEQTGESEDDTDALDDADAGNIGPEGLDAETLLTVLSSKLEEAGLDGADSGVFLQSLTQMLQGDGDMDDVAGNLAKVLLENNSEADGGAMMDWLSRQGVKLDEHTEDESESMHTTYGSDERVLNRPLPGMVDSGSAPTEASAKDNRGARKRTAAVVEEEETPEDLTTNRSIRKRRR